LSDDCTPFLAIEGDRERQQYKRHEYTKNLTNKDRESPNTTADSGIKPCRSAYWQQLAAPGLAHKLYDGDNLPVHGKTSYTYRQ
jgi:hypothetical protein